MTPMIFLMGLQIGAIFSGAFMGGALAWAGPSPKAHVHGAGQLQVAFEGTEGRIEFVSEASAILGFEQVPKTDKQKATLTQAISQFRELHKDMVQWDATLGCTWTPEQVDQVVDSKDPKHSDFVAKFKGLCVKSPKDSAIKLNFRAFPRLKKLSVDVLIDDLQKAVTYTGKPITIELK